jgi:N-methylhydantoinase A
MYRIGVDVGGTFTDFVLLDEVTGQVRFHKVPSTPRDPAAAIAQGIREMLDRWQAAPDAVSFLGHGTTVATNMVIERKGSPTAVLTTRGFRDVLEIARQQRPHLYDYRVGKPPPLVPREHRHEVAERLDIRGDVLVPLDEADVKAAAARMEKDGIRSVAVCFLHAYREPAHERRALEIIRQTMPGAFVSLSSDVLPEFREYERLSTTVINAFVGPRMADYLSRLLDGARRLGIRVEPYTIQSNGRLMSVESVRRFPVRTCLSGPAAGVIGAAEIARHAEMPNIITFDVGGTSTDVSLVHDAEPALTGLRNVAQYPVRAQMIDIHVIGAGGGSIGWLDDAGGLKAGPHSAGADPGPAAYRRGGTEPTMTDANIALGRLDPDSLLGGRFSMDRDAAVAVIEERIARPLGLTLEAAAHGLITIANANMARAIRSVSTERGHDVAGFALFAFGGAGPLHAAELAAECGIPRVLVPREPGTMCARGMLLTDISLDFVRSEIFTLCEPGWARVAELFAAMRAEGERWLAGEGVGPEKRTFGMVIEARYEGQNFEIRVPVISLGAQGLPAFLRDFAAGHGREYGYDIPGRPVEIVNCRLQAIGRVVRAPMEAPPCGGSEEDALTGQRPVYFGHAAGWVETRVFARERLPLGCRIEGPAVIDEMSATTLVLPKQSAQLDAHGNIVIELPSRGDRRHA